MSGQKTFEPLGRVPKMLTPMVTSPHPTINEQPLTIGSRQQPVDIEGGGGGVGIRHIKKTFLP